MFEGSLIRFKARICGCFSSIVLLVTETLRSNFFVVRKLLCHRVFHITFYYHPLSFGTPTSRVVISNNSP